VNKKLESIISTWGPIVEGQMQEGILGRIARGEVSGAEYAAILAEIYWQVREHPQHLAAQTVKFDGAARKLVGPVLKHAASEVGHEAWALKDREVLGFDRNEVLERDPLPATKKLLAFMRECHSNPNPAAYMGYVFHLEFLPTQYGEVIGAGLAKAGIPQEALKFLGGHIEADEGHNKIMDLYAELIIQSPEDQALWTQCAIKTAFLYASCLESAARSVRLGSGRSGFAERVKAQRIDFAQALN
jgi:pyrroloquinoline quinone (PQQ) biosynthesis protein C